jgi:nucleoside-diphosphate-sugar epimerase
MRILVTGGSGFIGSKVCRKLRSMGNAVTSYDVYSRYIEGHDESYEMNVKYRNKITQGVNKVVGDVNDNSRLVDVLLSTQPQIIIHLAALPLANRSVVAPGEAFDGLLKTSFSVLDAIRIYKLKCRLVFISSSMVYGDFENIPVSEGDRTDPKEIYGSMKLGSEYLARAYSRVFDIPLTIVRPSAVYGPGDTNRRVVQIFVENAMEGKPITLNGPSMTMDFTYVDDIAHGISMIPYYDKTIGKTYNITTGQGRTLMELAALLKSHFPSLEIICKENDKSYIPKRGSLSIEGARKDFDYKPKWNLETGLADYIDAMRGMKDGVFRDY